MKAKELIRVLQAVDPNSDVIASVGHNDENRALCAKAELMTGECISVLTVGSVEILGAEGGCEMYAILLLDQENVDDLWDTAEEFDKLYQKREGENKTEENN